MAAAEHHTPPSCDHRPAARGVAGGDGSWAAPEECDAGWDERKAAPAVVGGRRHWSRWEAGGIGWGGRKAAPAANACQWLPWEDSEGVAAERFRNGARPAARFRGGRRPATPARRAAARAGLVATLRLGGDAEVAAAGGVRRCHRHDGRCWPSHGMRGKGLSRGLFRVDDPACVWAESACRPALTVQAKRSLFPEKVLSEKKRNVERRTRFC